MKFFKGVIILLSCIVTYLFGILTVLFFFPCQELTPNVYQVGTGNTVYFLTEIGEVSLSEGSSNSVPLVKLESKREVEMEDIDEFINHVVRSPNDNRNNDWFKKGLIIYYDGVSERHFLFLPNNLEL